MWLACHTQEEIAERVKVSTGTAANWCNDFLNNSDSKELSKYNFTDYAAPLYNVWKQQAGNEKRPACAERAAACGTMNR